MKKLLFSLSLLCLAYTAQAQTYNYKGTGVLTQTEKPKLLSAKIRFKHDVPYLTLKFLATGAILCNNAKGTKRNASFKDGHFWEFNFDSSYFSLFDLSHEYGFKQWSVLSIGFTEMTSYDAILMQDKMK